MAALEILGKIMQDGLCFELSSQDGSTIDTTHKDMNNTAIFNCCMDWLLKNCTVIRETWNFFVKICSSASQMPNITVSQWKWFKNWSPLSANPRDLHCFSRDQMQCKIFSLRQTPKWLVRDWKSCFPRQYH